MKNLIISIICVLLLLVPWSVYHRYSVTSTARYRDVIMNQTIPAAEAGDWKHAEESFDFIAEDWNQFQKISAFFIDTRSINDVTAQISRVSCYIRQQDEANSVVEADTLQQELDRLHKNDAPSADNLF